MKVATAAKSETTSAKTSTDEQRSGCATDEVLNPLWMSLALRGGGSPPVIQRECDACTKDDTSAVRSSAWSQMSTRVPSLQRKCSTCEDDVENSPRVQFALHVNQPNDPYEREADAVADAVANESAAPSITRARPMGNPVQAQFDGDARSLTTALASSDLGEPVLQEVRERVEPVLGVDLSHVRIRRGSEADAATRSLGARAFTHRGDIWLRSSERPNDLRLMAHELTHTVQQGAAPIQREHGHALPTLQAGIVRGSVQRSCDSEVRGEGLVRAEPPQSESSEDQQTERGRRLASRAPPGAQRRDIIEQARERERARDEPAQIGPAPLSGIVVRAPDWTLWRSGDLPLFQWTQSTGNVPFIVIPIANVATIELGGEAHAGVDVHASHGRGILQNIRLGLSPTQEAMFRLGSAVGLGPDNASASGLLRFFGDFRGQAELYAPASFRAEFTIGASLQALAEAAGVIDVASIRGGLEARAHASANLEFRGQLYFDCTNGQFSFSYTQALPLQASLGLALDAIVGGSFGIWPIDYTWEKRWNLACWRWMRQWNLSPRLTINYNGGIGAGRADAFDARNAFEIDFENLPIDDFRQLVGEMLDNDDPGQLVSRRRGDPEGGNSSRDRRSGTRDRQSGRRDRRPQRNLEPTPEELHEHQPTSEDPGGPRTCASEFPGAQICTAISNRLYSSVDAALIGVQGVYPDATLGNVRRVTGNECQQPLRNGHIGVYTTPARTTYAGTIFGCRCCDDGEETRDPRMRDVYTTNVAGAAPEP